MAQREDSCGAWAALRRMGQPFAGPKSRWQRLGKGEAVSRREMGNASRGRPDVSFGSCRDRHAPKGTGRGLLEAKIFGSAHLRCAQGSCGTRRGAWGQLRVRRGPSKTPYLDRMLFSSEHRFIVLSLYSQILASMRVVALITAVSAFRGPVSRVVRARARVRVF